MAVKPKRWRRIVSARAGLGLVAALWCAGAAGVVVDEVLPDDDQTLTLEEYLWCRAEVLRLEGEDSELDLTQGWEVARYNAAHEARNALCAGKSIAGEDYSFVEEALTPEHQEARRRAGAARLMEARAERQGRRAHVKGAPATVRAAPDAEAAEVGALAQWEDVFPTGGTHDGWVQVEWGIAKVETEPDHAWVHGALLAPGAGAEARFDHCEDMAGAPGAHNEIVRGRGLLDGDASVAFHNGHPDDAYVKLVRQEGEVIAFLVAGGDGAEVNGVPPGTYEVLYGTGRSFSRKCDSFSKRGVAKRFVEPVEFVEGARGWIFWVESVSEADEVESRLIDYAAFDNL